ncbi:hypothetical protein LTR28_004036 [Elasticomyces elasticus]|nr:hypothetical protein LTR28_004036 [Elasticomyces elasticus]
MANEAFVVFAPGVFKLTTLSLAPPSPGPGQVLVRIRAVSLNYRDILIMEHSPAYPTATATGLIPCSDAAGLVEAVGHDSQREKGDRVVIMGNNWLNGTDSGWHAPSLDGTLRRWMVLDDGKIVKALEGLSFENVAPSFTAGCTAMNALYYGPVPLTSEMTVLTQGTGGVSCAAIQLAAAAGATAIATSSSNEKLQVAKRLGAKHVINYRETPDWAAEALSLTGAKGVDHVVDVGGADTIEQSLKAVRTGGLASVVGILSESHKADLIPAILFGAKSTNAMTVRGILGAGSKEMLKAMIRIVEKHQLQPPVAKVFDFEQAREAFAALKELSGVGKIVINC